MYESSKDNLESIDISGVLDILTGLQLHIIPQDYVDQVINSHYNHYIFPEAYEFIVMGDIDFLSIIDTSCKLLNTYLQQPSLNIRWNQLIIDETLCVHPKSLSCLLNCYIQNGIKNMHQFNARKNGLFATRLFFLASTFIDSKMNGFYHTCILTKSSELIKSCIASLYSTGDIYDLIQLKEDERDDLMADLLLIVRDIEIMVKKFKFVDEKDSLELIIDLMVDITRLERTSGKILEQVPTGNFSYSVLAFNAYSRLTDIFNDNCGSTYDVSQQLLYYMLPGLLVDTQHEMQLTTKQFKAICDHHLSFIHKLTIKLGTSFTSILEIVLQHLIHRGPDHNELKSRQFRIILNIWRLCPNNIRIKMKFYLLQVVYIKDVKIRTVALEILFNLLLEPEEIELEDPQLLPLMPATKHEFIVAVILSKFQDPTLTVRVKAISLFVKLTAGPPTATAHQTSLIKHILVDPYHDVENFDQTSFFNKDFHDFQQYLQNDMANFDLNNISNFEIYPGAKTLLQNLNVHACDERVLVRRPSLTLLCNIFLTNEKLINDYYLTLLVDSCSDYSMTIRKVVVSGLTELLLKYPDNQNVLKGWFKGLIYLVGDNDKEIQNLTIQCMTKVILKNIKPYSVTVADSNDPLDSLPWRVLDHALNKNVRKYMLYLCEKWHVNKVLTDFVIKDIMTFINLSNHKWTIHSLYFLELISNKSMIRNLLPVQIYFENSFNSWFSNEIDPIEQNTLLTNGQIVISILFLNYKCLDNRVKQKLLNILEEFLFDFKVPTRLISISLDLYTVLQLDVPDKCNTYLKNVFFAICNSIRTNLDKEIMIRQIFTLGEISLTQNLQIKNDLQQYLLGFFDETYQTISSAFRAILILSIGKLSINDELFAKNVVVQCGMILKMQSHPSIKINALTILADLCVCWTSLVEPFISDMCICLKAESKSVKRVVLERLKCLIREGYIKPNIVFFCTFLCMIDDPDLEVCREVSSFIINYFLVTYKHIVQKIVEVIFYFNNYNGMNATYGIQYSIHPDMEVFFSMEGNSKKAFRHRIYCFIITHISDENKLKLMAKLLIICVEIVKNIPATTKNNEVKDHATQVIKDIFWILKAKEMALMSGKPRDNTNDDGPETLEILTDTLKNQVVVMTKLKMITQFIIPFVFSLKNELVKKRKIFPTVMNEVRAYLCTLIAESSLIKTEVFKLLSVDSELLAEIQCDIKQHQQQNRENGSDDDYIYDLDKCSKNIEYIAKSHMINICDQANNLNLNELKIQENQPIIPIEGNDLHNILPTNFKQPVNKNKVSNEKCEQMVNVQTNRKSLLNKANIRLDETETDPDDDDLPGYGFFH